SFGAEAQEAASARTSAPAPYADICRTSESPSSGRSRVVLALYPCVCDSLRIWKTGEQKTPSERPTARCEPRPLRWRTFQLAWSAGRPTRGELRDRKAVPPDQCEKFFR